MECGTLYSSGLHLSKKTTFSGQFQKKNFWLQHRHKLVPKAGKYLMLMWTSDPSHIIPDARLSLVDSNLLLKSITVEEVETAGKLANPNKAPGPDGFNSYFFKVRWPLVGKDVCEAVFDFF